MIGNVSQGVLTTTGTKLDISRDSLMQLLEEERKNFTKMQVEYAYIVAQGNTATGFRPDSHELVERRGTIQRTKGYIQFMESMLAKFPKKGVRMNLTRFGR